MGLIRSSVYFKTGLYKFLKKFRFLEKSTLSSHYFKNHFKMIKSVCKSRRKFIFTDQKNYINDFINHYCFWLFSCQKFLLFIIVRMFRWQCAVTIFLESWELFFPNHVVCAQWHDQDVQGIKIAQSQSTPLINTFRAFF